MHTASDCETDCEAAVLLTRDGQDDRQHDDRLPADHMLGHRGYADRQKHLPTVLYAITSASGTLSSAADRQPALLSRQQVAS